jgi:hypothetical protein
MVEHFPSTYDALALLMSSTVKRNKTIIVRLFPGLCENNNLRKRKNAEVP